MIRMRGSQFELVSSSGRVLGTHGSRSEAEAQEKAIQISKARKAGHRIPRERKR